MGLFKGGSGGLFGGAATGAMIGSVGGPWGAAIGAGIGGIAGATGMLGRSGIGGTITGQAEDTLKYDVGPESKIAFNETPEQRQFLEYLKNRVYNSNYGPSLAESVLAQKTAENNAAVAGAMASARGVSNPVIIAREAAKIQAANNQQAGQAGAILRAQEEQQRRELENQTNAQFMAGLEANRQAAMDYEKMKSGVMSDNVKSQNLADSEARKNQISFLSGLGQAGATIYSAKKKG